MYTHIHSLPHLRLLFFSFFCWVLVEVVVMVGGGGWWGVVALICSLITQTPLRQPDRLAAAGVLAESHQQPAHAPPGSDHQEFHRWETCSEFRRSPCIHLIVMEFLLVLSARSLDDKKKKKKHFIPTSVINSGKSNP